MVEPDCIGRPGPAPAPDDAGDTITPKDIRKRVIAARDVVFSVDLIQLFRNEVCSLRLKLGDAGFNDLMSTVDVETMEGAKAFLE